MRKSAARLAAPLETCIHCALCSDACHWYLSHDKDPTYAPVAKVRMTLWEMIKRKGKVSPEFIKQCARIAFCECNLCRRCSMYCPFGLDIAYQMGMIRRICFLLGVVPRILMDYDNSLSATLTQLWISQADWIDTLQWQEEEVRAEIKNARIPVDKEGARVKAEQIKATGCHIIVAPCHNCHVGIHDVVKFYNIDADKFMWDILLETMEVPNEMKVNQ